MLHKFGSNWDFKTSDNLVILMNSTSGQLSPPACFYWLPVTPVAALGFALAWRRPRRGFLLLPGRPFIARASPPFFFSLHLLFRSPPSNFVELAPSPWCISCHSKACHSLACSLRTQPAISGHLISPGTDARRLSSSRPATPPSSSPHRGRCSTVRIYPCFVALQLHHVTVILCNLLIEPFLHCSH